MRPLPSCPPALLLSAVLSGLVALATGCGDPAVAPRAGDGSGGGGSPASGSGSGSGGSGGGGDAFDWQLPPGFPRPRVPADNPMSEAKVELGRRLFYDVRLSGNQTYACASCHRQALAFTDGRARAVGSTGEVHPRGSMSIVNAGYNAVLTWANPTLDALETQALAPMFGTTPVELGLAGKKDELLARLAAEPVYQMLFPAAFPAESAPISIDNLTRAIAAFERTVISARSPYDRYSYDGDLSALSAAALRGRELFFSEKFACFHCHGGFNFADSAVREGSGAHGAAFHNTGLYNIDGKGAYPADNTGLFAITAVPTDMGRFRAPTLRNIAVTAPYMHDGSVATLSDALDHYAAGGRTISEGPDAGVGSENPFKSELIVPFPLSAGEKADMIAFLESLTDQELLTSGRLSDPWTQGP